LSSSLERERERTEGGDRERPLHQFAPLLAPPPLGVGALEGEAHVPPKDERTLQPHRRRKSCGRGPEVNEEGGGVSRVPGERSTPRPFGESSPDFDAPQAHTASIAYPRPRGITRTG
jgi:hypothetical protein